MKQTSPVQPPLESKVEGAVGPSAAPTVGPTVRPTAKLALLRVARNPVEALFVGLIRLYQVFISPVLPSRCKYYPSCSQYALDAVREYGAARGLILGAWRILRCNPLSYGGYDPVSNQKLFRPRQNGRSKDECCSGPHVAGHDLAGRHGTGLRNCAGRSADRSLVRG